MAAHFFFIQPGKIGFPAGFPSQGPTVTKLLEKVVPGTEQTEIWFVRRGYEVVTTDIRGAQVAAEPVLIHGVGGVASTVGQHIAFEQTAPLTPEDKIGIFVAARPTRKKYATLSLPFSRVRRKPYIVLPDE